ncbi:energy transducer TonB [Luteimonas sp. JM171]|uniref:energy transducer TonB n=1 Tax=Luteimonas sp. JM171 TaxID=1896164 RepID=UPI000BA42269
MSALWIVIALAATSTAPPAAGLCSRLDPELIHCPAPEAPRITELREGHVTLEVKVDPDGSVRSSKVLSSSGHPAWASTAQAAVAKWHYVAGSGSRTREVPFDFLFGDP